MALVTASAKPKFFFISNNLAVMGAFEAYDDEIDVGNLFIAQINDTIILHSDRQIYARDGHLFIRWRTTHGLCVDANYYAIKLYRGL